MDARKTVCRTADSRLLFLCVAATTLSILCASPRVGKAQRGQPDPNSPRPPTVALATSQDAQIATFTIFLSEVVRAIQSGDTLSLSALVPDRVIPAAEKNEAASLSCPRLSNTVLGWRPRGLSLAQPVVLQTTPLAAADSQLVATANIWFLRDGGTVVRAPVRVVIARDGNARTVDSVGGLLLAVCQARQP